jgi:multidrug efflux pump subunit AcrB
LNSTSDIVDVDWMTEDNQTEYKLEVDKEKAMLNGVAPQQIVGNLTYLMKEYPISNLYDENSNDNVGIVLALDDKDKTSLKDIQNIKIKGSRGNVIPVSDLVKVVTDTLQKTIYRKDQKRVVYVTADMAGTLESPVYAILGMNEKLQK